MLELAIPRYQDEPSLLNEETGEYDPPRLINCVLQRFFPVFTASKKVLKTNMFFEKGHQKLNSNASPAKLCGKILEKLAP